MNLRRWVAASGVAALLGLAAAVPPAFAEDTGGDREPAAVSAGLPRPAVSVFAGQQRSVAHVTLITGDRVTVDGMGRVVHVAMGPGRAGITWRRQLVNGRTLVIPSDAVRLINRGRLDRRLFDVGRLVADGYDDAHRARVPLIVSYAGAHGTRASATRALSQADAVFHRNVPALGGQALVAARHDTAKVWRALTDPDRTKPGSVITAPGVDHVWLDGIARASADTTTTTTTRAAAAAADDGAGTAQIGAPDAWKSGLDGKGVTVAVLDSGIDATHPDLKGKVIAAKDFSRSGSTDDLVGHGTHVASTIVGTGAASGGKYRGVAPGARLLVGKVLDNEGGGLDSDIIAGMQWAADRGAKVVNMSLGGTDSFGIDPLEKAVNELSAKKGVLFALAAGNEGPDDTTLDTPGSAAAAITVAAVDHDDKLAPFSSRGPTVDNVNLKPDISAPGVDIVAARAAHARLDGKGPKGYVTLSGTSMATPHVAGAAAILAQQHPDWTGAMIKAALMGSTKADPKLTEYEQGAGRVDLSRAIKANVVAEPASLPFGTQSWPHADDMPVTKILTYRNTGTTPVTLTLAAGGEPGVFSVSPTTLTIPAGGTATATATADTSRTSADGVHFGMVTATSADGTVVGTPGLIIREGESYNLTLKSLGPDGKVPDVADANMYSLDSGRLYSPYEQDTDGDYKVTLRLPKGRYVLDDFVDSEQGQQSVLVAPNLVVSGDATVVLDHRTAKPIKIIAPDRAAIGNVQIIQWGAQGARPEYTYAMGLPDLDTRVGQVGPDATAKDFIGQVAGTWAPGRRESAPQYHIVVSRPGTFFTGLTQAVDLSSMARVDLAIGATVAKTITQPLGGWSTPGFPQLDGMYTEGRAVSLPKKRTSVYLTTTGGLRWGLSFALAAGDDPHNYSVMGDYAFRRYEPGRTYRATYGSGVFGPTIADNGDLELDGWRYGDTYSLCLPMLSDGHLVLDDTATKKTTLTAGGKTYLNTDQDICDTAGVGSGLPDAKTRYTLTSHWTRSLRRYKVSNRVTATWTFTSEDRDKADLQRLPLSAVRFNPRLSLTNTTTAGRTEKVPVIVQGAAATRGVRALSVRVSYDAGRTWKTATVKSADGARYVTLTYPKRPGTVSLRTTLTDIDGNGYTATISNAYRTVR